MNEKQSLGFSEFYHASTPPSEHRLQNFESSGPKRKVQKEYSGITLEADVLARHKRGSDSISSTYDENQLRTSRVSDLGDQLFTTSLTGKVDGRSDVNRVSSTPRHWTEDEDQRLREAVDVYGEKHWKKIAEHVQGRNHTQCLQRWSKVLSPGLKKGQWSTEEDQLLLSLATREVESCLRAGKQPKVHWGYVKRSIPGRTAKQCRERWVNNLNPEINRGEWTLEEDKLIICLYKEMPSKWAAIAKHLNRRTENAVKVRWRHLDKNDNSSVIPSRPYNPVSRVDSLLLPGSSNVVETEYYPAHDGYQSYYQPDYETGYDEPRTFKQGEDSGQILTSSLRNLLINEAHDPPVEAMPKLKSIGTKRPSLLDAKGFISIGSLGSWRNMATGEEIFSSPPQVPALDSNFQNVFPSQQADFGNATVQDEYVISELM